MLSLSTKIFRLFILVYQPKYKFFITLLSEQDIKYWIQDYWAVSLESTNQFYRADQHHSFVPSKRSGKSLISMGAKMKYCCDKENCEIEPREKMQTRRRSPEGTESVKSMREPHPYIEWFSWGLYFIYFSLYISLFTSTY